MGHIFANAAEEKIDFFEKRPGEIREKFGREDLVRGIGAWISRGGLEKMPWHSSACTRVRYAKTIPRIRGIVYQQYAEHQLIGCQKTNMIICAEITLRNMVIG